MSMDNLSVFAMALHISLFGIRVGEKLVPILPAALHTHLATQSKENGDR